MSWQLARHLRRDAVRDWFGELYGSDRKRSLVGCSLVALEGGPGSSKMGMLGRLSKMGFRTVCLPFVPFVRTRLLTQRQDNLEQINEDTLQNLTSEWAKAWYAAVQEQYLDVQANPRSVNSNSKKDVIFALRYPPITLATSIVGRSAEISPPTLLEEANVAVLECVSDGIRARERLAERFWNASEDRFELRIREAIGERDDGTHSSAVSCSEAVKQARFQGKFGSLHSTDTKQAVAALLEMVGHVTEFPSFLEPPRLQN